MKKNWTHLDEYFRWIIRCLLQSGKAWHLSREYVIVVRWTMIVKYLSFWCKSTCHRTLTSVTTMTIRQPFSLAFPRRICLRQGNWWMDSPAIHHILISPAIRNLDNYPRLSQDRGERGGGDFLLSHTLIINFLIWE